MTVRAAFAGNAFVGNEFVGNEFAVSDTPPPPDVTGPVCGTVSLTYAVSGTVSIEGCEEDANMIAVGNDIPILLSGALNSATDQYLNGSTVAFTLYARNGTTVLAGPTTMDYVTASNGDYIGVLQSSVVDTLIAAGTLEIGLMFPVKVTLADGTLDGEWDALIPVGRRTWNC